jgi:Mrp family chromosome partitioning ATPase
MRPEHTSSSPSPELPAFAPVDRRPENEGLGPYFRAVRRHAALVVAIVVVAVGASVLWQSARTVSYKAIAQVLVTPLPGDEIAFLNLPVVREAGDPTRTIQTAASLVDTHEAAALAASRLGDPWTRERVEASISVDPQGQTNIIDVTGTAEDPEVAAELANSFAKAVIEIRSRMLRRSAAAALQEARLRRASVDPASPAATEIERSISALESFRQGPDPTLAIAELAAVPTAALGTPAMLVIISALIAGIVLGTGLALLLEITGAERIDSEDDLARVYPLPVLAQLPKLSRRRARQPVSVASDPRVREAYRSMQVQLALREAQSRVVMITSPSRRDGKTTVVATFARELEQTGTHVVVVGADMRGKSVRAALGLDPSPDRELVEEEKPLDELMEPVPGAESLDLLDLRRFAGDVVDVRFMRWLRHTISITGDWADQVIVDTPPLGEISDALALVDTVDDVILVVRLGSTRRRDLQVTRDLLDRAGVRPTGFLLIGGSSHRRSYSDRDR